MPSWHDADSVLESWQKTENQNPPSLVTYVKWGEGVWGRVWGEGESGGGCEGGGVWRRMWGRGSVEKDVGKGECGGGCEGRVWDEGESGGGCV